MSDRDQFYGQPVEERFHFHGVSLHLDDATLSMGEDLWNGLANELGKDGARGVLIARLEAAARVFEVPSKPVPDIEKLARTPPAGLVLMTSMAALLAGGIKSHQ